MNRFADPLVVLGIIVYSYWMVKSSNLQNLSEPECKDLATLDRRCNTQVSPQADESPPAATSEISRNLEDVAEEYWSQYLCQKEDSRFFQDDSKHLYELRNVKFQGDWFKLTPADKLNDITARGYLQATAVAHRYYELESGKWSSWIDGPGKYLLVTINNKNGKWEIEDQPAIVRADCQSLPN